MADQVGSITAWMFAGGGPQTSEEGVSASGADISEGGEGAPCCWFCQCWEKLQTQLLAQEGPCATRMKEPCWGGDARRNCKLTGSPQEAEGRGKSLLPPPALEALFSAPC